jgi:hypothetical protein
MTPKEELERDKADERVTRFVFIAMFTICICVIAALVLVHALTD